MENTTRPLTHVIKGIIIAVLLMVLDYIGQKATTELPTVVRYLPLVFMVVGIAASCIIYGYQTNGTPGFGDLFAHGFKTTAVVAVFIAIYTFIIIKYVFPPTAHDIDLATKALLAQGGILEQEARQKAIENAKNAWVIEVSLITMAKVVTGLVGSLIGAGLAYLAFAKKKP
ncbi:MAG TPA: hypothetical protein VLD19_21180 [Chitinophagaceae bacterium]|nr:hypothetical protein [Chitinophagaceae bacterium]